MFCLSKLAGIIDCFLKSGQVIWGAQKVIGRIFAEFPKRMKLDEELQNLYRLSLKLCMTRNLRRAATSTWDKFLDITKEVYRLGYFDQSDIVELIDCLACFTKSWNVLLFKNFLHFIEAFRTIFSAKKISKSNRAKVIEIGRVLFEHIDSERKTDESCENIKKILEVLRVEPNDLQIKPDEIIDENFMQLIQRMNTVEFPEFEDLKLTLSRSKAEAKVYYDNATKNGQERKFALFIKKFFKFGPRGFLFKEEVVDICFTEIKNQNKLPEKTKYSEDQTLSTIRFLSYLREEKYVSENEMKKVFRMISSENKSSIKAAKLHETFEKKTLAKTKRKRAMDDEDDLEKEIE